MTCRTLDRSVVCCLLLAFLPAVGRAQEQEDSKVEQLERKVASLESLVGELSEQRQQGPEGIDESLDEIDEQMFQLAKSISDQRPGKRKFLLTGYSFAGFEDAEGSDSTFAAGFVPIFLWKLNDRLFVQGEAEFELEDDETHVELEYVQMSYLLNDYMTLGVGKFLNPANPFADRLHPAWINKLPDAPLAFGARRIMPFTQMGAQLHGGLPVGSQKLNYTVYVSNGPTLEEEDTNYGVLEEDNFTDANNNKAVGGRVGYFPLPELEIGYAIELSQATASGSDVADADATIQSFDLNYVTSVAKGTLDLRAQWAFSDVDDVTFDPTGSDGFGPVGLDNKRNGGYLQAAFRPSELEDNALSDLEGVVRYDQVDLPSGAPEGTDESRVTIGLNYWTSASSVFKLAYQFDDVDSPGMGSDTVMLQWAIGF